MKRTLAVIAFGTLSAPAVAADKPPTAAEIFTQTTIPTAPLVQQWVEYDAVLFSGKSCKLVTDAEQRYWSRLWYAALETLLSERDQKLVAAERLSTRNSDKVDARVAYFLKTGCGSPELGAKIRDMKGRMRLSGYGLKQLEEANGQAVMDLSKEPAE